jgi:hypothetical protein
MIEIHSKPSLNPKRLFIGSLCMLAAAGLHLLAGRDMAAYMMFTGSCLLSWIAWSATT